MVGFGELDWPFSDHQLHVGLKDLLSRTPCRVALKLAEAGRGAGGVEPGRPTTDNAEDVEDGLLLVAGPRGCEGCRFA